MVVQCLNFLQQGDLNREILKTLVQTNTAPIVLKVVFQKLILNFLNNSGNYIMITL